LYSPACSSQKYQRSGLFGDFGAGRSPGLSQPWRSHIRTRVAAVSLP